MPVVRVFGNESGLGYTQSGWRDLPRAWAGLFPFIVRTQLGFKFKTRNAFLPATNMIDLLGDSFLVTFRPVTIT